VEGVEVEGVAAAVDMAIQVEGMLDMAEGTMEGIVEVTAIREVDQVEAKEEVAVMVEVVVEVSLGSQNRHSK
jgi:hypothetical protein